MSKLVKNYLYNLTYGIITIIVPLITAPYLTRTLHSENFGIYSYVSSITSIILTIVLLGIYSYGNRQIAYCRENENDLSETFWEIMTLRLFMGIIGTVIYVIYALKTGFEVFFFLYFGCFLANVFDCSWVFVGMENMKPCVIKNTIAKILTLIGVFLFVKTENDVGKYIFLVGTSGFIVNLAVYSQLRGIIKKPVIKPQEIITHLKGSFYLFLPQLASLLYLQVDKAMIQWITSETSQISFYDQAEKIVTIALSIITALSTVMMPRIANVYRKGDMNSVEGYLSKASRFSLLLAFPMTIGLQVTAMQMIPWYLGSDYIPSAYAIIIIAPIVISNSMIGISGKQFFVATNKVKILTIANSVSAILNIIINAILIPKYQYIGAAIATTISSFVNVAIQYTFLRSFVNIRKMVSGTLKYLLFSLIMGGVVITITTVANPKPTVITTIIQVLIGVVVYGMLLIISKDNLVEQAMDAVKAKFAKGGQK